MAERQRIGFTFSYDEDWIAGTYYVLNIIHALKLLPDSVKPELVIISEDIKNYHIVSKETNYPFLSFFKFPEKPVTYAPWERFLNKVSLSVFRKKMINKRLQTLKTDFVYPFHIGDFPILPKKQVNWVPDFQEVHLPDLFSKEVIQQRRHRLENVVCNGDWVVFSSLDSQNDFNKLYPDAKIRQYVLPFAVTHPEFEQEDLNVLKSKYNLPKQYYFAPNQFWAHKNHMVILKALKQLKEGGLEVVIAFSGKENDHRNIAYTSRLKQFIEEHGIESSVRFLGFLPRTEQLKLMQGAIAIVQPSKFEGWSTVVEDAKALNQFTILSNLRVHKEQTNKNVVFFDPDNYTELSEILERFWNQSPMVESLNYMEHRKEFAANFIKMAKEIVAEN